MKDPGGDRTYMLPKEQSDLLFTQIAQTMFAGTVPQDQPVATILSAQPGAGKTVLAQDIKATYPEGSQPVAVDMDAFRGFHPEYERLRAEHGPQGADDLVQAQTRIWFESAIDYLVDQGSHLIVEHGLRDREVTDRLLTKLSDEVGGRAPYRIEAALLASPAAVSDLGILERYQLGHEMTGQGRIVAADLHDQRYAHLAEIADWLDADPRVTAQAVYQRGSAEPVHRNERLDNGELRLSVATRTVLEEVRNQPFTLEQSRAYLTLHASLRARMAHEWEPRLQRALDIAAPLLHPEADASLPVEAGDDKAVQRRSAIPDHWRRPMPGQETDTERGPETQLPGGDPGNTTHPTAPPTPEPAPPTPDVAGSHLWQRGVPKRGTSPAPRPAQQPQQLPPDHHRPGPELGMGD